MAYTFPQQRISKKQKTKNNYSWAKSVLDEIERQSADNRLDAGMTTNSLDTKKVMRIRFHLQILFKGTIFC